MREKRKLSKKVFWYLLGLFGAVFIFAACGAPSNDVLPAVTSTVQEKPTDTATATATVTVTATSTAIRTTEPTPTLTEMQMLENLDEVAKAVIKENAFPPGFNQFDRETALAITEKMRDLNPNVIYMENPDNSGGYLIYVSQKNAETIKLLPEEYQQGLVAMDLDKTKQKDWLRVSNKEALNELLGNRKFLESISTEKIIPVVDGHYYDSSKNEWIQIPENPIGWEAFSGSMADSKGLAKFDLNPKSQWQVMILMGQEPEYLVIKSGAKDFGKAGLVLFKFMTFSTDSNGNIYGEINYVKIELTSGKLKSEKDPSGVNYNQDFFRKEGNRNKYHINTGGRFLIEIGSENSIVDMALVALQIKNVSGMDIGGTGQSSANDIGDPSLDLNQLVETIVILGQN